MHRNSPTHQGFVGPDDTIHQQQTVPVEHEPGSPPPYTPTTDEASLAKGISSEYGPNNNQPLNVSTSLAGNSQAYTQEPPMSAASADPWSKYDETPGCCCSTTGGCCFSSRGGCCFSDSEGCCFSSTKGCCFSSNAACCFSGRGGSMFCSSKGRK